MKTTKVYRTDGTLLLEVFPAASLENLKFDKKHAARFIDADFRGHNLRHTSFLKFNFRGADFRGVDLRKTLFYGSYFPLARMKGALLPDYEAIPFIPNIHKKVYDAATQPGALDMGKWHTCEMTHCWGGWVVELAGDAGFWLEKRYGTDAAASLIYMKSDPNLDHIPDWYTSGKTARAAMEQLTSFSGH